MQCDEAENVVRLPGGSEKHKTLHRASRDTDLVNALTEALSSVRPTADFVTNGG